LGYLTPKLIDAVSQGNPGAAGRAYAVNAAGCIFGPLVAGYVFLPALSVRAALIILALPFAAAFALAARSLWRRRPGLVLAAGGTTAALLAGAAAVFLSYEEPRFFPHGVVRRDATASVISIGQGRDKRLLVNGISMTLLTPITKCMVHLPLGILERRPESALVVCVGMGTSFRSAASWGIPVTGVELIPSVAAAFGYYFEDARRVMHYPRNRIVIDDGRRFLRRETGQYDLISIDPPPPIEASGTSVLYSREFYRAARLRLRPDGILQQWLANCDETTRTAMIKAICAEFPHVRAFQSMIGWGTHFFASARPFEMPSPEVFAARLPPKAARDLLEWNPGQTAAGVYELVANREVSLDAYLRSDLAPALTDDRPINEYFLLRRLGGGGDLFSKRGDR
jgi:spermidine synthase